MGLIPALLEDLTGSVVRDAPFSAAAQVWQSLHSADPGTTGAFEATSGTGAGGRQLVDFTSGGSGTDTNSNALTYQLGSTVTVTWIGFWSAQTGGTFLGGFPLVGSLIGAVGISGSPTVYAPAHGLPVGTAVRPYPVAGVQSAVPTPLSSDVQYLVASLPSLDSLTLVHAGGLQITLTSSGAFALARDRSVVANAGEIVTFAASTGVVYSTVS